MKPKANTRLSGTEKTTEAETRMREWVFLFTFDRFDLMNESKLQCSLMNSLLIAGRESFPNQLRTNTTRDGNDERTTEDN